MHIVITGASRGIGRAIAEKFAGDGMGHHFYLCARNAGALSSLKQQLIALNGQNNVFVESCDFMRKDDVRQFANLVLQQSTGIDILVNNAGIFLPGNVSDETEGFLEDIMQVNVFAPYHLTRMLLPLMMRQKSGHIFNISSIAALKAYPGGGSYSISKFALDGFSKNLRHELMPHGIKVTCLYPGATYTDSWKTSGLPEERFMKPEDIADLVYACSRLSPQACVEEIVIRPQLGDI